MTYNWNADSGDKFTLPLGLTFGRTLLLGNGDGLGLSIGAYNLAVRPDEGSVWQFKFGIAYFFNYKGDFFIALCDVITYLGAAGEQ